jgi:hypothetical protein
MDTGTAAAAESVAPAHADLFPTLHLDNFKPMELCFATLLALATNRWRQRTGGLVHLRDVLWALREALKQDPLLADLAPCCGARVDRHDLLVRAQVSFWAHVLGVPVQEVCQWASVPRLAPLARALGLPPVCHPQRIAEWHGQIGAARRQQFYARAKTVLCHLLAVDRLTEADLERTVAALAFEPLALEMGRQYGFSYFLNFVFWQGVFARLAAALAQPLAPNGYAVRELLAAYFRRFDYQATTPEALAEDLRNDYWAPSRAPVISPVSQTVRNFLAKLDPERVIGVYEAQARRALRPLLRAKGRRTRLTVAVDATLLRLFGDFAGQEALFDHVTQQHIRGYKLYVLVEVSTRQPLAFILHEPGATRPDGTPKGDADYLQQLVAHVKTTLGVDQLAYVLFDKGFWSQDLFQHLVDQDEVLVTPGKRCKTVRQAVTAVGWGQWVRAARNQRVADTQVTFENGLTLRLVVWKTLGQQVVRDEHGKPQRDQHGKTRYEPAPIYYSYVTNISAAELDPAEVVGLYGQRWSVEDFFEQMDNQYFLGRFPATDLARVKVHIALTFLGYTLLTEFQRLVAQWLDQAEYATMELRRFARLFLRAPVAWLHWLKQRRPGQRWPRWRHRHRDFLGSLAAFGGPAPSPELL